MLRRMDGWIVERLDVATMEFEYRILGIEAARMTVKKTPQGKGQAAEKVETHHNGGSVVLLPSSFSRRTQSDEQQSACTFVRPL